MSKSIKDYIYGFLFLLLATQVAHAKGRYNEETFTLSNGLQVVVISDHRAPIIFHAIGYNVGGVNEKLGLTGQAHLLEHLMFKGTAQRSGKDFDLYINSIGGSQNAFTTSTSTAYYQITPSSEIETLMKWEAARMRGVIFSKDLLDTERKIVFQEKRQRLDANPYAKFFYDSTKDMFKGTVKDRSVLGKDQDITAITVVTLKEFYDTYYHPNNAYVVLAGDITLQQAKKLAEENYGHLKSSPIVKKSFAIPPKQVTYLKKTYKDKRVNNRLSLRRYFISTNAKSTVSVKEIQALKAVSYILFNSQTNPAKKEFVESGIFTHVGIDIEKTALGIQYNIITTRPANKNIQSKNVANEDKMIGDWLKKSKKHLTKESLLLAKISITNALKISKDDTLANGQNILQKMGDIRTSDLQIFEQEAKVFQNLTLKDLHNAYDKYLLKAPYFFALLKGEK